MAKNSLPSLCELQRCFELKDGVLLWRERAEVAAHVNSRFTGRAAGSLNQQGYRQIEFDGAVYVAHRIIFKMAYGRAPVGDVDHIDGNRLNNHPSNLRECTHQQNGWNAKRYGRCLKGVSYRKRDDRYYAQITTRSSKRKHLGSFATEQEAHLAYRAAALCEYGPFARFE